MAAMTVRRPVGTTIALFTALLIAAPNVATAQANWPAAMSETSYAGAKSDALGAQPACVAEVSAGAEASACRMYRLLANQALGVFDSRNDWCLQQVRKGPTPAVCLEFIKGPNSEDMLKEIGWSEFEALSRKAHPDRWIRADAARAEVARTLH